MAQLRGNGNLLRMWPSQLIWRSKLDIRTEERLDAHRRGHARCPSQAIRVRQQQCPDRGHQLGAVEERQPLLGLEDEWLEADLAEGDEARNDLSGELDAATSDQRQGEMGQRGEIAGG